MFIFFKLLIIFCLSIPILLQANDKNKLENIKIAVLIIASDDIPVYKELAKIWQSYMHVDPEHFECYFIRGNNKLPTETQIIEDTIWCKTTESVIPGILNKTLLSIKGLLPRLDEFDYILRTNLSSFYVFPRLLETVKELPRQKCYAGYRGIKEVPFASGSGFLLSKDLVLKIINQKHELYNDASDYDDVVIGRFLYKHEIEVYDLPREDILSLEDWCFKIKNLNKGFHFRVKNKDSFLRLSLDSCIYKKLINYFY